MRQVCFRLPGGAAELALDAASSQPLRLGSREAEALAEVLQVFACGEESAAIAFGHLAGTAAADAPVRDALSVIAAEEEAHEALLRGLRSGLPEPAHDRVLRRALVRYYHGLAQDDPGLHLAGIASLDSAVCTIIDGQQRHRHERPLVRHQDAAHAPGPLAAERGQGVGLAAPDEEHHALEQSQQPGREHQHVAVGQAGQARHERRGANQRARRCGGEHGAGHGGPGGQAPAHLQRPGHERPQNAERALAEVDDARHAMHQGKTERHQRVDGALHDAADEDLDEGCQRVSPAARPLACSPAPSAGRWGPTGSRSRFPGPARAGAGAACRTAH